MYYVGIDQSIRNTGWCVVTDNTVAAYGNIKPKNMLGPARLCYIRDAVADVLSSYPPLFAAMEEGSYQSSGQLFQLGGVHALVQTVLWDAKVPFAGVAPVQLKKFATGKSGAKKEWIVEAARLRLGLPSTIDDNVADAACLALIARALVTSVVKTRAEAEVVHKLRTADSIWRPEATADISE
jgi:Holliday junction resolvasome RuvABC endonuclease subunit